MKYPCAKAGKGGITGSDANGVASSISVPMQQEQHLTVTQRGMGVVC